MRTAVYTEPIARTPAEVWEFLTDRRNDVRWRREIVDVELIEGDPRVPGARYREIVEWEGIKSKVELTVPETSPGKRVVILSDDPGYRTRSVWTFEPQGETTLVTLSFSFEATGALSLAEPLLWKLVSRWLERDLPLLEGHLG